MSKVKDWIEFWGVKAKKGDIVKFIGEGGSWLQLERAKEHLTVGEIYTIDYVYADIWGVYYYLEEVKNKSFPEDMFERL